MKVRCAIPRGCKQEAHHHLASVNSIQVLKGVFQTQSSHVPTEHSFRVRDPSIIGKLSGRMRKSCLRSGGCKFSIFGCQTLLLVLDLYPKAGRHTENL